MRSFSYYFIFLLFFLCIFFSKYGIYNGKLLYNEIVELESRKNKINAEKKLYSLIKDNSTEIDFIETRMRYVFGYTSENEETFFWKDECGEVFDVYLEKD